MVLLQEGPTDVFPDPSTGKGGGATKGFLTRARRESPRPDPFFSPNGALGGGTGKTSLFRCGPVRTGSGEASREDRDPLPCGFFTLTNSSHRNELASSVAPAADFDSNGRTEKES